MNRIPSNISRFVQREKTGIEVKQGTILETLNQKKTTFLNQKKLNVNELNNLKGRITTINNELKDVKYSLTTGDININTINTMLNTVNTTALDICSKDGLNIHVSLSNTMKQLQNQLKDLQIQLPNIDLSSILSNVNDFISFSDLRISELDFDVNALLNKLSKFRINLNLQDLYNIFNRLSNGDVLDDIIDSMQNLSLSDLDTTGVCLKKASIQDIEDTLDDLNIDPSEIPIENVDIVRMLFHLVKREQINVEYLIRQVATLPSELQNDVNIEVL